MGHADVIIFCTKGSVNAVQFEYFDSSNEDAARQWRESE